MAMIKVELDIKAEVWLKESGLFGEILPDGYYGEGQTSYTSELEITAWIGLDIEKVKTKKDMKRLSKSEVLNEVVKTFEALDVVEEMRIRDHEKSSVKVQMMSDYESEFYESEVFELD